MSLHKLIYVSKPQISGRADVDQILEASERNNGPRGLTGMLLFDGDSFLQLLEGDRAEISQLFLSIAADSRHSDVEIIASGPTECRLFADWSMRYVSTSREAPALIKYASRRKFDARALSVTAIEQLCLDYSKALTEDLLAV